MCITFNFQIKSRPSTSASFRVSSQPIKILEIPPYRRNQSNQNPTAIVNPSPPRIPEIPSYKSRKSNDWHPTPIDNSNHEFQQLHLPAAVNSDLIRRLKNSDSSVHRSIDCIAAGTKIDANTVAAESAPTGAISMSNVAQRSESITSTSGINVGTSKKSSIDDDTKGKQFHSKLFVEFRIFIF